MIEFKENHIEKLQKAEGENKGLIKDINDMREVINALAPILGEYLKTQMVLMV